MTTPRKHAALIKAWADGAEIERFSNEFNCWVDCEYPLFSSDLEYRIKTENIIKRNIYIDTVGDIICRPCINPDKCNIEFTFNAAGQLEKVRRI